MARTLSSLFSSPKCLLLLLHENSLSIQNYQLFEFIWHQSKHTHTQSLPAHIKCLSGANTNLRKLLIKLVKETKLNKADKKKKHEITKLINQKYNL